MPDGLARDGFGWNVDLGREMMMTTTHFSQVVMKLNKTFEPQKLSGSDFTREMKTMPIISKGIPYAWTIPTGKKKVQG